MNTNIPINNLLRLTAFEPGDKPNLLLYMNDEELYNNTLRVPSPYTAADADTWLGICAGELAEHGRPLNWAIRHHSEGVIGGIGCFLRTGPEGHRDEIGYWLAAPYRGNGIMTTVIQSFCAWLFDQRKSLVRIEAKVFSFNPASARVLEKAGFEREGFARKHTIKNGELIDVILMAKIRE